MGGDPILQKNPMVGIELVETPALDRHSRVDHDLFLRQLLIGWCLVGGWGQP